MFKFTNPFPTFLNLISYSVFVTLLTCRKEILYIKLVLYSIDSQVDLENYQVLKLLKSERKQVFPGVALKQKKSYLYKKSDLNGDINQHPVSNEHTHTHKLAAFTFFPGARSIS